MGADVENRTFRVHLVSLYSLRTPWWSLSTRVTIRVIWTYWTWPWPICYPLLNITSLALIKDTACELSSIQSIGKPFHSVLKLLWLSKIQRMHTNKNRLKSQLLFKLTFPTEPDNYNRHMCVCNKFEYQFHSCNQTFLFLLPNSWGMNKSLTENRTCLSSHYWQLWLHLHHWG